VRGIVAIEANSAAGSDVAEVEALTSQPTAVIGDRHDQVCAGNQ
jgi:hypothetical protein